MDIKSDWNTIRIHFNRCFKSNLHVSVASVNKDNIPTVTPIGSLFLNDNLTGIYFEKYISKLPLHSNNNKNICVLAVNSNKLYWLRSLFRGKFKSFPAIKLYGKLGKRRKANQKETHRLNRRMKMTKGLKGNSYLWRNMEDIREITFYKSEKINLGSMTQEL